MENKEIDRVLIVGGGFGGVKTAISLAKRRIKDLKIILVSDKTHFEYHAALYRLVTGKSPLEVCIPMADLLKGYNIEFIEDKIDKINLSERNVSGVSGSNYNYDFLVLALGSETSYFNIPGLKEYSYSFKSITQALRLKRHLHTIFEKCKNESTEEKICSASVAVVGGGPSGVELAGELAIYLKKLAKEHNFEESLLTLSLFEAAPRLLPMMEEKVSEKVKQRLSLLGVNIFLNRNLVAEEIERIYLKDMQLNAETLIWTAGVKSSSFYSTIEGLKFDKKGKVIVDQFLQADGFEDVFVIGDAAATKYSGLAQTALKDGVYVARAISSKLKNIPLMPYVPVRPFHSIPVGPGWAVTVLGKVKLYGYLGWLLRRTADLRFFLSVLPVSKAIDAFRNGKTICESCNICQVETE